MEAKTIQADKIEELKAYIKRLKYSLSNQGNAFAANRNELIKALQNLDVKDKEIATHKAKIEYLEAEIAELKTPGRDAAMALVNAYMRECGDDGRLPPICDKERIAQAAMSYRAEIINNTEAFAAGLKGER